MDDALQAALLVLVLVLTFAAAVGVFLTAALFAGIIRLLKNHS